MTGQPVTLPCARLQLRASPATLRALGETLAALMIERSPVVSFLPVLGQAVTMLTGGVELDADPDAQDGTWQLFADGKLLRAGTVEL